MKTVGSAAERLALAGALLLLATQAAPALHPWLEYRRGLLAAEPWRVLTAHFVHVNWVHALINAAAWVIVARLFAPELGVRRQAAVLLACALAIGIGLAWLHPAIVWYRGFSGVLHGLYFAGAACWLAGALAAGPTSRSWLPALLLVCGWVKVLAEQPVAGGLPFAEWLGAATVPQAHLLGAAAGTLLGPVCAWRSRRAGRHRTSG